MQARGVRMSVFKRRVRPLHPQSAACLQNHLWGPGWNLHLAEQSCGGKDRGGGGCCFYVLLTFSPGGPIGPWGPIRPWKTVENVCYWNLQFGLFTISPLQEGFFSSFSNVLSCNANHYFLLIQTYYISRAQSHIFLYIYIFFFHFKSPPLKNT